MSLLEGLLFGFGTVLFVGPVFFTLLQIAIDKGVKAGVSVALGIVFSDVVIIALLHFGLNELIEDPTVQNWLAALGSVILLVLGLKHLLRPSAPVQSKTFPNSLQNAGSFIKGFLVNFVNPFVFFVWVSIMAYSENNFSTQLDIRLFLIGTLLGIFITDALKALFASKLQNMLQPLVLKRLFMVIGVVLIGFGLRLIYFIATQG